MKNPFQLGETKEFTTQVTEKKLAEFDSGIVHPVYGTFALGRDAEWACRLFVLEMKEEGEEGIGSYLSVEHLAPAPLGSEVRIIATLDAVNGSEIVCSFAAHANGHKIAQGRQVQKIINQKRFTEMLQKIKLS
jgi:fluoroacetyl-CoA thioesterase